MTHVEYWVANDGTRFECEFDCLTHELKQRANSNNTLYATKGDKIYRGEQLIDEDIYNSMDAIYVNNEDDLKLVDEIRSYAGFYLDVNCVGSWRYDVNRWKLDEAIKRRRIKCTL